MDQYYSIKLRIYIIMLGYLLAVGTFEKGCWDISSVLIVVVVVVWRHDEYSRYIQKKTPTVRSQLRRSLAYLCRYFSSTQTDFLIERTNRGSFLSLFLIKQKPIIRPPPHTPRASACSSSRELIRRPAANRPPSHSAGSSVLAQLWSSSSW